jgi:hypothetical protein
MTIQTQAGSAMKPAASIHADFPAADMTSATGHAASGPSS